VIHGAHNTPALARSWSQMDTVSNQNGFIVMYPAGLDCWNAGGILPGCTAAADDVGFLRAAIADVESHTCIDPKRVYATGISNGSIMAQYMGCKASDIFASVGGVAGGVGCTASDLRLLRPWNRGYDRVLFERPTQRRPLGQGGRLHRHGRRNLQQHGLYQVRNEPDLQRRHRGDVLHGNWNGSLLARGHEVRPRGRAHVRCH
jgi:poly(3-hydroxybutyrate) depolymerase